MAQKGAAELIFRGRREQKAAFPPCVDRVQKQGGGISVRMLSTVRPLLAGRIFFGAGGCLPILHGVQRARQKTCVELMAGR